MSRAEYMKKWRKKRKEQGLCPSCSNKVEPGKTRCLECGHKKAEYCMEWRENNPVYHSEYNKNYVRRKKND